MSLIQFRIHPSVGMARFGESKQWYFLGPELPQFIQEQIPNVRHRPLALRHPDAPAGPAPAKPAAGRIRDATGLLLPQAARFRVFAYIYDNGTREPYKVVEVTAADADITWTVTLANRKTVKSGVVAPNDPAPVTLQTSPASPASKVAKGGGLPNLAWLTLEASSGRLHLIGNEGEDKNEQSGTPGRSLFEDDWYDAAADGPVSAKIKPKAAFLAKFPGFKFLIPGVKDPAALPAAGADAVKAWAVVNLPDYVPDSGHFISLWDLALGQSWKQAADGKVSAVDGRHFLATSAAEINDYRFYDYHTHMHPQLTLFSDVSRASGQTRNATRDANDFQEGIIISSTLTVAASAAAGVLKCATRPALELRAASQITADVATHFDIVLTPDPASPFATGKEIVRCTGIADDGTLTVTRAASGTTARAWSSGATFYAAPRGTFVVAKLKGAASAAETTLTVEPVEAHKIRQPSTVAGDLNDPQFLLALVSGANVEWVKCTANDKLGGRLTVVRAQAGTTARAFPAGAELIAAGGGHKSLDARASASVLSSTTPTPVRKRIFERLRLPKTVYERTSFAPAHGGGNTSYPRQHGRRYDTSVSIDTVKPSKGIPASHGADPEGSLANYRPLLSAEKGKGCKGADYGLGGAVKLLDDMYWIVTERDMPMLKEYAFTQIQFDQFEFWTTGAVSGTKLRHVTLFDVLFKGTTIGDFLRDTSHTTEQCLDELARCLPRYLPAFLDMASLGKMLGGSFLPGIEVGLEGGRPHNWSLTHGGTKYFPDLRFHPKAGSTPHPAGMLTKDLAIPWFNDFIACDETYWPTSRPQVVYQEQGFGYQWLSGRQVMEAGGIQHYWKRLGFVRRNGAGAFVEQESTLQRP